MTKQIRRDSTAATHPILRISLLLLLLGVGCACGAVVWPRLITTTTTMMMTTTTKSSHAIIVGHSTKSSNDDGEYHMSLSLYVSVCLSLSLFIRPLHSTFICLHQRSLAPMFTAPLHLRAALSRRSSVRRSSKHGCRCRGIRDAMRGTSLSTWIVRRLVSIGA